MTSISSSKAFFNYLKYFVRYIFVSKTRQRLLFIALIGLVLSSSALLILQSTMTGLQNNLVNRSVMVTGHGLIIFKNSSEYYQQILNISHSLINELKLDLYPEYELELLVRNGPHISAAVAHGLDSNFELPKFIKEKEEQKGLTIVPVDLCSKLKADHTSEITLISPAHTNALLGDIPREVSTYIAKVIETKVPEIDQYHLWTRSSLLYNLSREKILNRIRIHSPFDLKKVTQIIKSNKLSENDYQIKTWANQNESLVWALNLESSVMLFLFSIMTLLVGISITSGLLIFFDKIQLDLVSMWMLGIPKSTLERFMGYFINILSFCSTLLGLIIGAIILFILDHYIPNIMPEIFVEQKIPVHITIQGILISFLIPYLMAIIFSYFSLRNFRKDQRPFLTQLRSIN
ncbi:MAG: ABC transporter permease [Oligoflexia bacterium]|nr:ABC transporter permease [Oligoflexia bacterium]